MRTYQILAVAAAAVSILGASGLPVRAQAPATPPAPAAAPASNLPAHLPKRVALLLEPLNLTADQGAQLKPLVKDIRGQIKTIRQNNAGDKKEQRKQVNAAWDTLITQLQDDNSTILTTDQKKQLGDAVATAKTAKKHKKNADATPAA